MADKPVKVNPIGQIADEVVEQVRNVGSSATQSLVTEPAKILEQILAGRPLDDVEQGKQSNPQKSGQASDDQALLAKKQEAEKKAAEAYKLHQQRLQEEIEYYQRRKAEEMQKKQVEEQQEQQKQQIVQLQKEKEEEEVWKQQIKAIQGSHEGQLGKM